MLDGRHSTGATADEPLQCAPMELRPFRSIRFSPRVVRARGLSAVFAPPYDQISPPGLERLYASAPENIVRITFRRRDEEDPYAGAAKTLADWLICPEPSVPPCSDWPIWPTSWFAVLSMDPPSPPPCM